MCCFAAGGLGGGGQEGATEGALGGSRVLDGVGELDDGQRCAPLAAGFAGRGLERGGRGGGGDVLNREAFEALLPCIFHADAVHEEVRDE